MGLFKKLRGEFVDIIQWLDDTNDKMVHRFMRHGNEIKNGAKLTVRESQVALFINEGKIADIFTPGMYELTTNNLPILSTLKGWAHGFNSPFKAEVYFINTKKFTNLKWGTKNPIMLRDREFGPIRLRAFGSYSIRVDDPTLFIKEIVGTDGSFTKDEVTDQLRNIVSSRFADLLGESNIPALDLAANYDELGRFLEDKISPDFKEYGILLDKLLVENISLPPAVEEAIDKRSSMGIVGDLNQYTQFQTANAMEDAAKNQNGTASGGIGMGMGMAMANQMGSRVNNQTAQANTPPPIPQSITFFVAINGQQAGPFDITTIKNKISNGEITRESLLWRDGMASWEAASNIPETSKLFGAVPPPIPS